MKPVLVIIILAFSGLVHAQSISSLQADMYGIASDATEGRFKALPGYLKAANYVVGRLKEAGIKSTFQRVPYIWDNYNDSRISVGGVSYSHSKGDFIVLQRGVRQSGKWVALKDSDSTKPESRL